jgi:hypothetical protein
MIDIHDRLVPALMARDGERPHAVPARIGEVHRLDRFVEAPSCHPAIVGRSVAVGEGDGRPPDRRALLLLAVGAAADAAAAFASCGHGAAWTWTEMGHFRTNAVQRARQQREPQFPYNLLRDRPLPNPWTFGRNVVASVEVMRTCERTCTSPALAARSGWFAALAGRRAA